MPWLIADGASYTSPAWLFRAVCVRQHAQQGQTYTFLPKAGIALRLGQKPASSLQNTTSCSVCRLALLWFGASETNDKRPVALAMLPK